MDNLLQEARNQDIKSILSYYGKEFYRNNCRCILHEDSKRSAYITRGNRLKCASASCILSDKNSSYSTIDVVMYFEPGKSERECAKRVLEISNTPINYTSAFISDSNKPGKKGLSYQDRYNLASKKNIDKVIRYLNSRGISKKVLPILDRNNIGYGADKFDQVHFFFTRQKFCIYRSKRYNENHNSLDEGAEVSPICIKANKSNTWYIVEGIYDGLSLLQFNYNVIVLNSVANTKKLIQKVEENKLYNLEYIIATDNDDGGHSAKIELEKYFKNNNICYDLFKELYNSNCKDINDLLKKGELNEIKTATI